MRQIYALTTLSIFTLTCLGALIWAQPTPAQFDRIAKLVEAGKLEEAHIRTETLLEIFPEDAQLQQMSSMLAQRIEESTPPPSNPALDRIRSALQSSKEGSAAQAAPQAISAMDQLEIQTVLAGTQQALQISDIRMRSTRLSELLTRKVPETALNSTNSEWLVFWQARAIAALETDNLTYGWQAVQALKRLNALNSSDPQLKQLIVAANLKGWLTLDREGYLSEVSKQTAITRRQAAWAGVHHFSTIEDRGSAGSSSNKKLIITATTPPGFTEWSEHNSRYSSVSMSRDHNIIPGEFAHYRANESSGWNESLQTQSRNELIEGVFHTDYSKLTISYKNSQYGTMKKTFTLDESGATPRIIGDDKTVYIKVK
jgi:hypothetical protein